MLHLNHFGLHRTDGDIALLVQQNRVDHILGVRFHVDVQVRNRRPCTHRIDLTAAADHPILADHVEDPVFRAMLPIPYRDGERPLFLEDTNDNRRLIQRLARLTSPGSFAVMMPAWMTRPEWFHETNIQPIVVHGLQDSVRQLDKLLIAGTFSPRRLIILGGRMTILGDRAQRVSTTLKAEQFETINLEAVGAYALRQHMQGKSAHEPT